MKWLTRGLTSSVGLKFVMGTTGVMLLLFVIGHLLGNLQVFAGPDRMNAYAASLKELGPLLWVMRLGLIGIVGIHILTAVALTRRNWAARPVRYGKYAPIDSSGASRWMLQTGIVIVLYVIYHLLHFTIGKAIAAEHFAHLHPDAEGRPDVYFMLVRGYQEPLITLVYILAMLGLWWHLSHGIGSFFQSMGWTRPKYRGLILNTGRALAALIALGFISIPVAAYLGWLPLEIAGS
jgi:succinate dehydrogenase / fumarate reductase cytochrome b subunit